MNQPCGTLVYVISHAYHVTLSHLISDADKPMLINPDCIYHNPPVDGGGLQMMIYLIHLGNLRFALIDNNDSEKVMDMTKSKA